MHINSRLRNWVHVSTPVVRAYTLADERLPDMQEKYDMSTMCRSKLSMGVPLHIEDVISTDQSSFMQGFPPNVVYTEELNKNLTNHQS